MTTDSGSTSKSLWFIVVGFGPRIVVEEWIFCVMFR